MWFHYNFKDRAKKFKWLNHWYRNHSERFPTERFELNVVINRYDLWTNSMFQIGYFGSNQCYGLLDLVVMIPNECSLYIKRYQPKYAFSIFKWFPKPI
jgi:hypothetical protein